MDAPDWYAGWRHEAVHELMAKQAAVQETYKTGTWPRYHYDLDAGTLTFLQDGVPRVVADIQIVGTTGKVDWLWSWANEHWPSTAVEDIHRVRSFGEEHGIDELTTAYLKDEELNHLGWEMTAVAARVLDAVGAYRPPSESGGALFFIYRSIEFVS